MILAYSERKILEYHLLDITQETFKKCWIIPFFLCNRLTYHWNCKGIATWNSSSSSRRDGRGQSGRRDCKPSRVQTSQLQAHLVALSHLPPGGPMALSEEATRKSWNKVDCKEGPNPRKVWGGREIASWAHFWVCGVWCFCLTEKAWIPSNPKMQIC